MYSKTVDSTRGPLRLLHVQLNWTFFTILNDVAVYNYRSIKFVTKSILNQFCDDGLIIIRICLNYNRVTAFIEILYVSMHWRFRTGPASLAQCLVDINDF